MPHTTAGQTVLLTGAAGNIGRAFRRLAGERYQLRLADTKPIHLGKNEHAATIALDVADLAACREACRGIDTVIHLAADPSPEAGFYESLLENNVKGVYNVYRAAADQGVGRVIFASSVHTCGGYPAGFQPHTDTAPRPPNLYGASKAFGEAIGSVFAAQEGLTSVAIRIGAFEHGPKDPAHPDPSEAAFFVSARDLVQLIERCVTADLTGFHVVHGLSNNRLPAFDISSTRALVGYEPQDDGFAYHG
ncbi:MAG: UDP-glucose 4-epimerase [uncultured Thermomicrobiales bacterium]|uniref:UDP-glucose 4-epimerase n=1 Tax=uncultured Thermomicrobiales bacterium TaxID=1645740 RepID=A0A6J4UPZ2_9BACT|nr:MAG: UDP-glucose 4-epimerase [uncultured Thermomicrobiales bacterium]